MRSLLDNSRARIVVLFVNEDNCRRLIAASIRFVRYLDIAPSYLDNTPRIGPYLDNTPHIRPYLDNTPHIAPSYLDIIPFRPELINIPYHIYLDNRPHCKYATVVTLTTQPHILTNFPSKQHYIYYIYTYIYIYIYIYIRYTCAN